jgi:hypothetical protein
MVRCIDCQALDIGLNPETDMWVHCSIKHAMDIANLNFRPQPKISREEGEKERECEYFCDREEDKTILFELAEEMGLQ